jgi:hypothetical protein
MLRVLVETSTITGTLEASSAKPNCDVPKIKGFPKDAPPERFILTDIVAGNAII